MSTPRRLTVDGEGSIVFQMLNYTSKTVSLSRRPSVFSNTTLRALYLTASREFEKQMLWGVFGCKRKERWLDEIA